MALGTVYRDCAVDTKAKLTSNDIHPDYRPTQTGCISADVEYVVDEKGMVETKSAHVVRTTKDTFGEAVLSMLPRLRYEPAMRDGVPVRQIVVDHQSMALGVSTTGRAPSKAAGQIPARC
ncbi:MAG: hypothetical protein JWM95_1020 [Gemmatimonadetes bacterium]|nr:hypothetical protein [Gemmatimonadota bacterium]